MSCHRCSCIYHGTEEIHITYHEGSTWCLLCGHRIKDGLYVSWLDDTTNEKSKTTRNPYLLRAIQILRSQSADGGSSERSSETQENSQKRVAHAIADTKEYNENEPEEEISEDGGHVPRSRAEYPTPEIRIGHTPENKDGNDGHPEGPSDVQRSLTEQRRNEPPRRREGFGEP